MDIPVTNTVINAGIRREATTSAGQEAPNAFGIGAANQPEPQLSPQARILQQNEQQNRERQESFEQNQEDNGRNDGFIRVSGSEGSTQKGNLSAEKAAEIYRSIEALL